MFMKFSVDLERATREGGDVAIGDETPDERTDHFGHRGSGGPRVAQARSLIGP